jgi:hypothetical protein
MNPSSSRTNIIRPTNHTVTNPPGSCRCAMSWTVTGILAVFLLVSATVQAQLSNAWIVPAAAHTPGVGGTFWRTDLSIHNPQNGPLPVVVQVLQTGLDNGAVPTLDLNVASWETVNLWDVMGPDLFDVESSGAILVYVPLSEPCFEQACDLLVTSRTYTLDTNGGAGEYGQAVPAATLLEGTDWWTFGYAAGILNDEVSFRCNIGVASWTSEWTQVAVDIQDAAGNIIDTEIFDLPPFGHLQRRLDTLVTGGSLVFYLTDGPDDSWVYPYASVVNQETGDPSYFFARYSSVGVSKRQRSRPEPQLPERGRTVHPQNLKTTR